jgi:hypothetical protein
VVERNAGNVADLLGWGTTIVSCILDCLESGGTAAVLDRAAGVAVKQGVEELILELAK